jgi:hypothetical protein
MEGVDPSTLTDVVEIIDKYDVLVDVNVVCFSLVEAMVSTS